MDTWRAAFVLIGTSIGAGFISGAELVRFFGGGYLAALFFSCACFFAANAFFLKLGQKYGGYEGVLRALFGRGEAVAEALFLCVAFVPCAGMLAGLDALFPAAAPLASLAGLALVLLFLARGTRGLALLNSCLVPLLLLFVVWYGRGSFALSAPLTGKGALDALLYAGMNVAFSLPVLCETGKSVRHPVWAAGWAALAIFACAVLILSAVSRAGTAGASMPFLAAVGQSRLFGAAVACAVLTSLASALYPLLAACRRVRGRKKYAAEAAVLLAAFALSRLGLSGVVRMLYPAVGAFGVFFSAFCVFYERFLQKHHKKVHPRRQNAEDKGRAHHKVELKHLPAVHDEVSEPRP